MQDDHQPLYESGEIPGSYVLQDWGYSALLKHTRGSRSTRPDPLGYGQGAVTNGRPVDSSLRRKETFFLTRFKLNLVGGESGRTSAPELSDGLTATHLISDYLRKLSEFVMTKVQGRLGTHFSMEDVQWCLTVPALWDDVSKQEMKKCASMAGMTRGSDCPLDMVDTASPHPVIIVLEPEAASLYCQGKVEFPLNGGDKFLIVDVGGGTVDLVLHEKIGGGSGLKVREVSPSCGGLFGGSFVDQAFFDFLTQKIGCFQAFAQTHTDSVLKLKGWWETVKYGFDGSTNFSADVEFTCPPSASLGTRRLLQQQTFEWPRLLRCYRVDVE